MTQISTVQVLDKDHAKRSPSGIATRKLCPGSVVLTRDLPRTTNRYAAEGTAAHTLALDYCLKEGTNAEAYAGMEIEADGFKFTVGTEMIDAVNDFCDYVRELIDVSRGDVLMLEQEVGIGWFTGEEGATGTADVVGIVDNGKKLIVIDLKYGMGVRVDIESPDEDANGRMLPNEQLVAYAAGALKDNELVYDEIETVLISIMQPRLQHVAELVISVEDLDFEIDRLAAIEALCDEAEREHPVFNEIVQGDAWEAKWLHPGEKQCKFCDAKPFCPALRAEVLNTVTAGAAQGDDFPDLTTEPEALPKALAKNIALTDTLSPELLSASMRSLDLIETWVKAVRAETERRLMDGQEVPGWGIYSGKAGNRAWSDPAAAEKVMKDARLKVDEMYKKIVITAPVAEKLLAKAKPRVWTKLKPLITRADGKPTVDRSDCGREPWHPATAESFPNVEAETESDPLLQ